MNIRRQSDLRRQRNSASRKRRGIGLLRHELKMRCIDRRRDICGKFRKQLLDDVVAGQPVAVLCFEEFFADDAVRPDEKVAGACHAGELSGRLGVEHAVRPNNRGIRVREQWNIDPAAIGEALQDWLAIVADRRKPDTLLLESFFGLLQLNQLSFAVRSPISGSEKQEHGAAGPLQRVEGLFTSRLVASDESRRLLTDR